MTAPAHAPQERVQLLQLTSLRFFAALAVVFSHLGFLRVIDNPIKPVADTIFHEGYCGVTFFFILSGFILSHTYQRLIQERAITPKKYILLRLARIYPLHFLTAAPFVLLLLYKQPPDFIPKILTNLTLLQAWIPTSAYYFSLNAPSWSLSVELFFYSSFIFLATMRTRALVMFSLALFFLISITAILMMSTGNGQWSQNGALTISHWTFYINPAFRLLDFIVGILIYRLTFGAGKKIENATRHEVLSVALLLISMYVFSAYQFPEALRSQLLYLPLMTYVIYSFSSGSGAISQFLKRPTLVLLGEASFSLYMIHQPLIVNAYRLYTKTELGLSLVSFSVLITIFCVLASVFTYKWIERPVNEYLKQKIKSLD